MDIILNILHKHKKTSINLTKWVVGATGLILFTGKFLEILPTSIILILWGCFIAYVFFGWILLSIGLLLYPTYWFLNKFSNILIKTFIQIFSFSIATKKVKNIKNNNDDSLQVRTNQLQNNLKTVHHITGINQLALFEQLNKIFKKIISQKLNIGELTYNRYRMAVENLHLSILKALEQSYFVLLSISSISNNKQYDTSLLEEADETNFQKIIYQRQSLWRSQRQYVDKLTIKIERAINEIFHINCKFANANFNDKNIDFELDFAIKELNLLTEKINKYTRK
jgi:hypothetical protein